MSVGFVHEPKPRAMFDLNQFADKASSEYMCL